MASIPKATKNADNHTITDMGLDLPDITEIFEDVITTLLLTPIKYAPTDTRCRWGVPAIIWGLSGIGKSERIEQIGESLQLPSTVLFPAQHPPEDFSGAHMPDGKGGAIPICTLPGIEELIAHGEGIVFLDEMSGAAPATQGAMLGFINDRRAGGKKLPPGIRILGAANPPEFSAGGFALEAPAANRFAHFQMRVASADAWAEWDANNGLLPPKDLRHLKKLLIDKWPSTFGWSRGVTVGFVKSKAGVLHQQPKPNNPQAGYAWPSPRTWQAVKAAHATALALGMSKAVQHAIIRALLGEGVGNEYISWLKNADLPLPEQVIVKGWTPNKSRLDITFAVMYSIINYVTAMPGSSDQQRAERYDASIGVWRFLKGLMDCELGDLAMRGSIIMARAKLSYSGHTHKGLRDSAELVLVALHEAGLQNYVPELGS